MQTFLPYKNFKETFKCLDYRRLGKQRVEAMQIYNIISGKSKKNGWKNHPAVKMWEGYEDALALYHNLCIDEWIKRGYNNNMKKIEHKIPIMPKWTQNEKVHSAYKQILLSKQYEWYKQFNWKEKPEMVYIWNIIS